MKTAIVYYSMSGNTKYVADKIAEKIDAFCERLKQMGKISVDRSLYM